MDAAPALSASAPRALTPVPEAASASAAGDHGHGGVVSLRADVPEALLGSMRRFIDAHPNWDQYRLFQAALAGFLVQNGVQSRAVTRCYVANMFQR
jgi:hypothetical protein